MEQSEQINELAVAVNAMQKEPLFALKDSSNPFFKSKYADLSSCWDAARKPLTDNGLSVIQTLDYEDGNTVIVTTLAHSSGQWIRGRLAIKPVKEDPQGVGSAITYGRRYSLASIIGLCPEDDDGEKATHPKGATMPPKDDKLTVAERKIIGKNLGDYGLGTAGIKDMIDWVAETKGCDQHDRKIGIALLDKKGCGQWIKDFHQAMQLDGAE